MVQSLGYINSREVLYFAGIDNADLPNVLPKHNWLLLAIANKSELPLAEPFAQACLDNNVLYICSAGEAASEIDDLFDSEIVSRKIAQDSDDYSDTPMTSFDKEIAEQLWYSAYTAAHATESINTIVCINLTPSDYRDEISELIIRINNGWIPNT